MMYVASLLEGHRLWHPAALTAASSTALERGARLTGAEETTGTVAVETVAEVEPVWKKTVYTEKV